MSSADEAASWTKDLRQRLDELLEEYRHTLLAALDGLSEQEARLSLVPSKTTLLGLVKHVTYVEGVWFDQALTGRSYAQIGIATTPDRSFTLTKADTVASISAAYGVQVEASATRPASFTYLSSSTVAVNVRCGRCIYKCCVSSHSTQGTPTSCASRS
jgi:hypothetical protein